MSRNIYVWKYGQLLFQRDLNKSTISLKFDIFANMDNKFFFQSFEKKDLFLEMCIFSNIFTKWSQNNVIFIKMFICLEILTTNTFSKTSKKKYLFVEILYLINSNFFKVISNKSAFPEMLIFSKIWTKNYFSVILKKRIYGQKNLFFKVFSK